MKARLLLVPAVLGLVLPLAGPAAAAPAHCVVDRWIGVDGCPGEVPATPPLYCAVIPWSGGDSCTFEAPATAVRFGGGASGIVGKRAWIAVQVSVNGVVIDSCYGQSPADGVPAACAEDAMGLVPGITYECSVEGTGGPKFHCADPPPLPIEL